MANEFLLLAAPMQGYTEAPWRRAHARLFGGIDAYGAPFARVEGGVVRERSLRDLRDPAGPPTVAQAIFRNAEELRLILEAFAAEGIDRVDLNLGCPFSPQVKKGRGAGFLGHPEQWEAVAEVLNGYPSMRFSAKMRLGIAEPTKWQEAIDWLNALPLTLLTLHPRTASQQYAGALHLDQAARLFERCAHPTALNGDILTPDDIDAARRRFPGLAGVMIGRGLLARPSLAAEYRGGASAGMPEMLALHGEILDHYRSRLCGDSQVLAKIRPFWDYAPLPHRAAKALRKARTLAAYLEAVEGM